MVPATGLPKRELASYRVPWLLCSFQNQVTSLEIY
jgi:hypothetical protein